MQKHTPTPLCVNAVSVNRIVDTKLSEEVFAILTKYGIWRDDSPELGTVDMPDLMQFTHLLRPDSSLWNHKQGRIRGEVAEYLDKTIDELLEMGVLKLSDSPVNNRLVIAIKRDSAGKPKGLRLCVDLRDLNKRTVLINYPLPHLEDFFETLYNSPDGSRNTLFWTVDAADGYWHLKVPADATWQLAFTQNTAKHHRRLEFTRCVMGHVNSAPAYQMMGHRVYRDLLESGRARLMLDDLMGGCKDADDLIEVAHMIGKACKKYNVKLRRAKCVFAASRIEVLGHVVDRDGVHLNPGKVQAIVDSPEPADVKELASWLGLCDFYRSHVPGYSSIVAPLNRLKRKDAEWKWGAEQQLAFVTIKAAMASDPVTRPFNEKHKCAIFSDASMSGLGGLLAQYDPADGKLYMVTAWSRTLKDPETRYSMPELEVLAFVETLRRYQAYLTSPFDAATDARNLRWVWERHGAPSASKRIEHWVTEVQGFYGRIRVMHIPGEKNPADYFSRHGLDKRMLDAQRALAAQRAPELPAMFPPVVDGTGLRVYRPRMHADAERAQRAVAADAPVALALPPQPISHTARVVAHMPTGIAARTKTKLPVTAAVVTWSTKVALAQMATPTIEVGCSDCDFRLGGCCQCTTTPADTDVTTLAVAAVMATTVDCDGAACTDHAAVNEALLPCAYAMPVRLKTLKGQRVRVEFEEVRSDSATGAEEVYPVTYDGTVGDPESSTSRALYGAYNVDWDRAPPEPFNFARSTRGHYWWVLDVDTDIPPPINPPTGRSRNARQSSRQPAAAPAPGALSGAGAGAGAGGAEPDDSVVADDDQSAPRSRNAPRAKQVGVPTRVRHPVSVPVPTPSEIRAAQLGTEVWAKRPTGTHQSAPFPGVRNRELVWIGEGQNRYLGVRVVGSTDDPVAYAPPELRHTYVALAHDTPFSGHPGVQRTMANLAAWWPNREGTVREWVSRCPQCQRDRLNSKMYQHEPRRRFVSEPFEVVHMDLYTVLQTARSGHKHVLVIADAFTGYVRFVPLFDKETETVARAFVDNWVTQFGAPAALFTDRGPEFQSRLMDAVADMLWIDRLTTASYTSHANGVAERKNRDLRHQLATTCRDHEEWAELLPALAFALNTSVNARTRKSPHELVFGRRPRIVFDAVAVYDEASFDPEALGNTPTEYGRKLAARLGLAWSEVAKAQRTAKDPSARLLTEGGRGRRVVKHLRAFMPRDLVWRRNPDKTKAARNIGPYRVIEDVSNGKGERWLIRSLTSGRSTVAASIDISPYLRRLALRAGEVADPDETHDTFCSYCGDGGAGLYLCGSCTRVAHKGCMSEGESERIDADPEAADWHCEWCQAAAAAAAAAPPAAARVAGEVDEWHAARGATNST